MPASAKYELIIFTRTPVAGEVKTRLIPALGPDGAAVLHEAFVRDLVARLAELFEVTLAVDPNPDAPLFDALGKQTGAQRQAQPGGDLGRRMADALRAHIQKTGRATLLMGTDVPSVPVGHITEAAMLLQSAELVFNPATDGGYYLVGASPKALDRWEGITKAVFTDIAWGTESVLHDTLRRAQSIPVALGPCWYDVDEPADLDLLVRELAKGGPVLPHTRTALVEMGRL